MLLHAPPRVPETSYRPDAFLIVAGMGQNLPRCGEDCNLGVDRIMKILIVDDDASMRELLAKFMSRFGQCDLADGGNAAFDRVRQALADGAPYDLISLDIMMPGMNGHEVLSEIRAIECEAAASHDGDDGVPARCRVVMVSARDDFDGIMESLRTQCDAYIIKPITRDKVVYTLNQLGLSEAAD